LAKPRTAIPPIKETGLQLTIHTQNDLFTNALREYCEEKLTRPLRRHQFDDDSTTVDVDGRREGEEVEVRARVVSANGPTLTASAHHEDAYAAIDLLVDKVERRLRDFEERRRTLNRKSDEPQILARVGPDDFFTEDEEDTLREIGALDAVLEA
jgi:putative sigma-54 modulation protein